MNSKITIEGTITSIASRNKDNVIFNVKNKDNSKYQVLCSFFCPVQEHDTVYIAQCSIIDLTPTHNGLRVRAETQPFVSIPYDSDKIKDYFQKILRGTGFGLATANRLYDFLQSLARDCRYGQDFSGDDEDPCNEDENLSVNLESKYLGDGVSAFLSEMSAKYAETYSESYPALIGSTNENRIKSGITLAQAKKLLTEWYNKRSLRKLHLLGLTNAEIKSSGVPLDTLYEICISNPYRIASIRYEKCDTILNSTCKVPTEEQKICGRINRFVFDYVYAKGHSCVPESVIRKHHIHYDMYCDKLMKEYFLVKLNTNIYLEKTYKIETAVAKYVDTLINKTVSDFRTKITTLPIKSDAKYVSLNYYSCKTLTDEQKLAIDGSLNCSISIITGGAGTGKSLVIREITRNLEAREKSYSACAFTGKAVSRLHQIMGNSIATTIDRLILNLYKGLSRVPSTIIIDEGSMVTTELFYRLLKAMEGKTINFIIVGDCNQLPPIGWGNLMRELMYSGRIPLFYLTTNQRIIASTEDRFILENANNLISKSRDIRRPIKFNQGPGFYVVPGDIGTVNQIVSQLHQANYNLSDLLILSPYKSYLDELNRFVQDIYLKNSYKYEQDIITGKRLWCVGDRVMMTKNNYAIGVMNGEEGYVNTIDNDGINVMFKDSIYKFLFDSNKQEDKDDKGESYDGNTKKVLQPIKPSKTSNEEKEEEEEELLSSDLIHSYAISVHKSQGSEADYVILFIPEDRNFSNFLNVNLLYTAITRTKKTIWIVASNDSLEKISLCQLQNKTDGLSDRLKSVKNTINENIIELFTLPPDINTSLQSSTALTVVPDSDDIFFNQDELFELYDDEF